MHVVAIRPRPGDEAAPRIDALCEVTGLPRYEASTRVRVLAGWPGVLTSHADPDHARRIVERLRVAKFDAWSLPGLVTPTLFVARRFAVAPEGVTIEGDGGEAVTVTSRMAQRLLVGNTFEIDTEHVLDRDLGGGIAGARAARALLGLPNLATVGRPVERRRERREGFFRLIAAGCPPIHFRASRVQYAALDGQALAPTRVENFTRAQQSLRDALPHLEVDDRLVARSAQARILGPGLPPTRHLETAIALLLREPGGPGSPYR